MRQNPEKHCWGDWCGPYCGFTDSCNCNCPDCREADKDQIEKAEREWCERQRNRRDLAREIRDRRP